MLSLRPRGPERKGGRKEWNRGERETTRGHKGALFFLKPCLGKGYLDLDQMFFERHGSEVGHLC